ncbi:MAG: Gfo/Idh/MocA family oxidoreductase [Planctomycetes bacterium]|nr:Gfo/Idh/MocA family oxidoreductase [Planctomycetota bacterium]
MNPVASLVPSDLRQRWPSARAPRPIVILGAGGIVHDAHLPAYRALGLEVAGIFDLDASRARATAQRWGIPRACASLEEALALPGALFDLALPPGALFETVAQLPRGSFALLQKPLGLDLADATRIRGACRERGITAAQNFQLRFSPAMLALADALERGLLGRLVELEVHVNCRMPWELWPFMQGLERMEIALHSIHYLDAIRALLGEPRAVMARTVKHPDAPALASSRTTAILDYADDVRCALSINHHHKHGPKHQSSSLRVEGTRGAAVLTLGVNLDYPRGRPDALEIALEGSQEWQEVPLVGNWFPDAFRGPMSSLQRVASGEDTALPTSVEDAWHTMALVEALYTSDSTGGTPLPRDPAPRAGGVA